MNVNKTLLAALLCVSFHVSEVKPSFSLGNMAFSAVSGFVVGNATGAAGYSAYLSMGQDKVEEVKPSHFELVKKHAKDPKVLVGLAVGVLIAVVVYNSAAADNDQYSAERYEKQDSE